MGYGVGQTTGQTGVGTTASTTGQTQQAGYGGKGGGQATQPQATPLAQPGQSSTAQASPSPVFGGNALGYNMSRLAQRMDPSATLPQAPQASTAPAQTQPAPTGGKGGGYGDLAQLPEVQDFLGQLTQQPQQQPYGVTGAQTYDPNAYYGMQQPAAQMQPPMENPFANQMQQYQQQMQDMQNMYQQQLNALRQQMSEMQDTGAQVYELGPGYEELTNATTTAEQEQAAEAEASKPVTPAPKEKITTGVKKADSQNRNIGEGQVLKVNGWYVYKDPDTGVQMKTKNLSTAESNSGGKYTKPAPVVKTKAEPVVQAKAAPVAKAKPAPAAKTKPAPAVKIGQSAGTSAVKAAPAKAAKKKAHGGVIHDGMSKRLKHMLGEK